MTVEGGLLALRLLLAGVFLAAAIAKLRDPRAARQALIDFGVPGTVAGPLGLGLPVAELAAAVALIPLSTVRLGAWAALILLVAFTAVITGNLARNRRPNCHCFGTFRQAPIGWATVVRNVTLIALAVVLLRSQRNPPLPSIAGFDTLSATWLALIGTAAAVGSLGAATGWMFLHLLRQNGRLLLRIEALEAAHAPAAAPGGRDAAAATPSASHGLAVGTAAPPFTLPAAAGVHVTSEQLLESALPVLLVFADPGCGPCRGLFPDLAAWQQAYADRFVLAVVTGGGASAVSIDGVNPARILLQRSREVAEAYRCPGTPAAVVVDRSGRIASRLATGADDVRALVASLVHSGGSERTLRIGDVAPPLVLTDLAGDSVAITEPRGAHILLAFWNPSCRFCEEMLPELRAFERDLGRGQQIVVISRGSIQENAALGLRSRVLLDQPFAAGTAFGVRGTPSAVALDHEGRVASSVVAGAEAIFALARQTFQRGSTANVGA